MGSINKFDYIKPCNLEEACKIMAEKDNLAEPFAGGTDLFVKMRVGKINPEFLIDLKGLGLDKITQLPNGKISIGALCTVNSIIEDDVLRNKYIFIVEAAEEMASVQIRNRATIGGNLCNASPSADLSSPLLAVNATAKAMNINGSRDIKLSSFFTGPGKNVLLSDEILTEIIIDGLPEYSGTAYIRLKRNAMDLALVNVSSLVTINEDGICLFARIVLGAVGPTTLIAKEAAESIIGTKLDEFSLEKAASLAADISKPIDDVRTTALYREETVKVLTIKTLKLAYKRAIQSVK